eukprot:CAMPEP_0119541354 /NCGR_PEP_ID=MMETSP1344-20130328/52909_1 /TAXON_ID=236787 /ORGANISM="Florenciella parvula, Strain CCMP2471" /LENGTH=140 /DNA_ID=CAMNT_0007585319 /DNA_START=266 /DNA_END=686 /DNA_ORIENTATION=-
MPSHALMVLRGVSGDRGFTGWFMTESAAPVVVGPLRDILHVVRRGGRDRHGQGMRNWMSRERMKAQQAQQAVVLVRLEFLLGLIFAVRIVDSTILLERTLEHAAHSIAPGHLLDGLLYHTAEKIIGCRAEAPAAAHLRLC